MFSVDAAAAAVVVVVVVVVVDQRDEMKPTHKTFPPSPLHAGSLAASLVEDQNGMSPLFELVGLSCSGLVYAAGRKLFDLSSHVGRWSRPRAAGGSGGRCGFGCSAHHPQLLPTVVERRGVPERDAAAADPDPADRSPGRAGRAPRTPPWVNVGRYGETLETRERRCIHEDHVPLVGIRYGDGVLNTPKRNYLQKVTATASVPWGRLGGGFVGWGIGWRCEPAGAESSQQCFCFLLVVRYLHSFTTAVHERVN